MYLPSTDAPLAAALALSLAAIPTAAAAKPIKVTMPASALKDPSSRVCMPRSMSQTVGKDKSQPATLCQTVADWAAHGVTVVAK